MATKSLRQNPLVRGAPADWSVVQVRDVAGEVDERLGAAVAPVVLSVTKHRGILPSDEYFDKTVHSRDLSPYKLVQHGQFAYATIHLDEGSIGIQRAAPVGVVSPMYTVFTTKNCVDPDFLLAVLKSPLYTRGYAAYAQGSVNRRLSISFEALGSAPVALPGAQEQRSIMTAMRVVEVQIENSALLVKQLTAQKRAIIGPLLRHAMRDAPPPRWSHLPVGNVLAETQYGVSCPLDSAPGVGVPILRMGDISEGAVRCDLSEAKWGLPPEREVARCLIQAGDLLFNRTNSRELVGKTGIVPNNPPRMAFASYIIRLRVLRDVDSRWLNQYFQVPRVLDELRRFATPGVSQWNINATELRKFRIAVPPPEVQRQIADLGEAFDLRIAAERAHRDALRELKRGLADALLSGRVRLPPHLIASFAEGASDVGK